MLPGIDDGAQSLAVSLEMARIATDDGITVTACTPHLLPGLFDNPGPAVRRMVQDFQDTLLEAGSGLQVTTGADVHLTPHTVAEIMSGHALTLNDTRYFLLEPPHMTAPPGFFKAVTFILASGFIPVITHPERLAWIDAHYPVFDKLARQGCLMQLTAGALAGQFGGRAERVAWQMIDEGIADVVASDAHSAGRRRPVLSRARRLVESRFGPERARKMFVETPALILSNKSVERHFLSRASLP